MNDRSAQHGSPHELLATRPHRIDVLHGLPGFRRVIVKGADVYLIAVKCGHGGDHTIAQRCRAACYRVEHLLQVVRRDRDDAQDFGACCLQLTRLLQLAPGLGKLSFDPAVNDVRHQSAPRSVQPHMSQDFVGTPENLRDMADRLNGFDLRLHGNVL